MADTALVTTVTSAAFVDLGALPLAVENFGNTLVYLNIAASQPSASAVGHRLHPGDVYPRGEVLMLNPWSGDTRHVWARAHPHPNGEAVASKLIVTGAP